MKKVLSIIFLFITMLIAGCGGTSGGSSGGGGNDSYNLGTLSNGSVVQSNANNLAVGNGQNATAVIGINGGSANSSFLFSFNSTNNVASIATVAAFQSVPGINVTPSTCNLGTAGTGLATSCTISISVESTVPSNTYYIYPTVSGQNTLSPLKILVSNKQQSNSKDITQFIINNVNGIINNNNISVALPYGTPLTNLAPSYVTTGVSVSVNGQIQQNGSTANDFANSAIIPVVYTVTAEDGSTQNYNVVVTTMPNTANDITAFSIGDNIGTITGNQIGVQVPHDAPLTNLVATFNITGTKVEVNGDMQQSGTSQNDFTNPVVYTVYAENGSTQTYTVTVTNAPATDKAITNFEVNGPSNPVLIDQDDHIINAMLPFGADLTTVTVNFDISGVKMSVDGTDVNSGYTQDFTNPVVYTVTAQDGYTQDYVVTVTTAPNNAKSITTFLLNGYPGVIINNNITVQLPFGTDLNSLIADFDITGRAVTVNNVEQVAGQVVSFANDTHSLVYTIYAADGSTQDYIVTAVVAESNHNDMLSFAIGNNIGSFEANNIIVVTLPFGTSLNNQIATFNHNGVKVLVNNKEQQSGVSANDFTQMVTYTVYAENGSTQAYYVLVQNAQSDAKEITAISFNGNDFTQGIDQGNHTLFATLPYGTDITQVQVKFDISGKTMWTNGKKIISGYIQDFTNPVVYTVRAADGSEQTYTASVYVAGSSAKAFTSFSLNGESGVINESTHTIIVEMGSNTDLTTLVADFTTTGKVVLVDDKEQTPGITVNDFNNPESSLVYTVYAANNSSQDYTVIVELIPVWENVGSPGFIKGSYVSMALNKATNQPYVTFVNSNEASVMAFNGNSWQYVGESHFSGAAAYTSIAMNPATNQPYVAYMTNDFRGVHQASVMRFDGSSWQYVGESHFSWGGAPYISITFNPVTNQPYVAFKEENTKISVMAFNGSSWQYVGESGFAEVSLSNIYPKVAFNPLTNQPYVAYSSNNVQQKANVVMFNGSSWQPVGTPNITSAVAWYPEIAFNPSTNQPYLLYQDDLNKASVMAFDSSSWQYVGANRFTAGAANRPGLAFNPSTSQPYVFYIDSANDKKATVMMFDGSSWQYVGKPGFSPLSLELGSGNGQILFDNDNRVLVAYLTSVGLEVMKY